MRELLPGLRSLAIFANAGSPNAVLEMGEAETAARRLGLNVVRSEVRSVDDFAPSLDALKDRAEALYVCSDPLITTNRVRLVTLALGVRLPTIHGFREFVEAGGLMSYGPNFPDLFRRAADYVDKEFYAGRNRLTSRSSSRPIDLIINLMTAKMLGLDVSATLLARANEVIE